MNRLPTIMIGRRPKPGKLARGDRRAAGPAEQQHGQSEAGNEGGERSNTVCTYIGRKVVSPMIDMLAKTARLAKAIGRRSHRSGATIGASALRSCQMKAARAQKDDEGRDRIAGDGALDR